jgi:hypothetical protein
VKEVKIDFGQVLFNHSCLVGNETSALTCRRQQKAQNISSNSITYDTNRPGNSGTILRQSFCNIQVLTDIATASINSDFESIDHIRDTHVTFLKVDKKVATVLEAVYCRLVVV